jgi:hypothetical protein
LKIELFVKSPSKILSIPVFRKFFLELIASRTILDYEFGDVNAVVEVLFDAIDLFKFSLF